MRSPIEGVNAAAERIWRSPDGRRWMTFDHEPEKAASTRRAFV
jgi:hypothetical protein